MVSVVPDRRRIKTFDSQGAFEALRGDAAARAVILTGSGRFFSFGFDIPEFLSYTREEFTSFLTSFTTLYRILFSYPKPLVAALNGHAVAGGCRPGVVAAEALLDRAREIAGDLASKRPAAFASIKALLRKPVADAMAAREAVSIAEFVDVWYSEPTWTNLRNITIR